MPIMDSLRQRWKRSVPSDLVKTGSALNLREGEMVIVTYTSSSEKMNLFSAFIREGLGSGDAVSYVYPDDEGDTVRAKLEEHGINVKRHEREGSLLLVSHTKYYMSNGKLDLEKAITSGLEDWAELKKKGYKHIRDIEDVGDFSFINGRWQEYVKDYWLDPRWDDPNVSEWIESKDGAEVVFTPFLKQITAINVERMTETEVTELLKALGRGILRPARLIDLLENIGSFSRSIGLDHERLVGRKFLLEFNPVSDYEKVVDNLAKESMANVEPIYVFTSSTSPIHAHLADKKTVKFFLTSVSTSTPQTSSENKVLLPAKNTPLILDALSKVLETNADANVCFVLDILSELLITIGQEKTFTFLRHALDLLSSKKITSLFLLNTTAHEPQVVSQLRNFFSNQLIYSKNGLEIVKTS